MTRGRPSVYTLVPFAFILTMTIWAALRSLRDYYVQGRMLLVVMDVVILIATIWVLLEALGALGRARRGGPGAPAVEPAASAQR
jgi:carbon starvation protein